MRYNAVTMTDNDARFMRQALALARRGLGKTSPNPMVGAVIVKEGRIIARGYHRDSARDHAEVDALKNAQEDVAGGVMYVTLEPCRHFGKTPPCTDAIIKSKIGRVVIGMLDPDPKMRGESVKLLQENGIQTDRRRAGGRVLCPEREVHQAPHHGPALRYPQVGADFRREDWPAPGSSSR